MSSKMTEKLTDHLRCPICFEFPEAEVYQCVNGHQICKECCSSIARCPQCRIAYGKPKIRNRGIETLLDAMEFECQHKECEEKVKREELKSHHMSCKYRPMYLCQLLGFKQCQFSSPQIPLLTTKHLQQVHHITFRQGQDIEICHEDFVAGLVTPWKNNWETLRGVGGEFVSARARTRLWSPILWKMDSDEYGPAFLILGTISMQELGSPKCSWISVFIGDSELEAKKYQIEYSIPGVFGSGQQSELRWTSTPSPYKTLDTLIKTPNFSVPLTFLADHVVKTREQGNNNDSLVLRAQILKRTKTSVSSGATGCLPKTMISLCK